MESSLLEVKDCCQDESPFGLVLPALADAASPLVGEPLSNKSGLAHFLFFLPFVQGDERESLKSVTLRLTDNGVEVISQELLVMGDLELLICIGVKS